jgi:adenylyl-sulfate kinase
VSAFTVWITGLPGSGKSTVAAALVRALARRGVDAVVLESDALRRIYTPEATYDQAERATFYATIRRLARVLARASVPTVVDATANLRAERDLARDELPRMVEVFVDTPLEVCEARDPKGLYRKARSGAISNLPGLQAPYEPPLTPELVVRGDREDPDAAGERIAAALLR